MKYKIKEIKFPFEGDYILPKIFFVPMVKLYWFLPWLIIDKSSEGGFKLKLPLKAHEVFNNYTDAEEFLNEYIESKIFGETKIIVNKYYDGSKKYCPVVIKNHRKYGLYNTSDNKYILDDELISFNSKEEANTAITVYLNYAKSKTLLSSFNIPYNKNNNNFN